MLQFIECVKTQTLLPDTKDFRPIIKETLLNASKISWNADKARKSLFAGKKFVFPTKKQLDTLKEVILAAGGKAGLLSYSGNWNKLGNENIVVIQQPVNKSNIPEELIYKFRELTG